MIVDLIKFVFFFNFKNLPTIYDVARMIFEKA